MRALIIEDDRVFRQIMRAILTGLGLDVAEAGTGQDAIAQAAGQRFDVIFLDLHLPDMAGYEVCQQIRIDASHHLTPIILLTAEDADTTLKMGFGVGITDVIRKCGMSQLHDIVQQIINRMQHAYTGRVLYVEDSPTAAQMTMHLLTTMGLDVMHCNNASEALEAVAEADFDVVITDIILEGEMSGLGLVRELRRRGDFAQVPILAVSAHEDAARRIEILRMGANDYVTKPIIEAEFLVRLGNLLTNKKLFDRVKEQQEKLRQMAITDPLTGMYNRRYLTELAAKYVSNVYRYQEPLSVIFVDVDHFKRINDVQGHEVGDDVLRDVGRFLRNTVREGDAAARMGGEEFLMLLPRCGQADALAKAESLRVALEARQPHGLTVTASLGVATLTAQMTGMNFSALSGLADEAMYRAKNGGRNRVEVAVVASSEPLVQETMSSPPDSGCPVVIS